MKFNEIMKSELNKNYPGDSIDNIKIDVSEEFNNIINEISKNLKSENFNKKLKSVISTLFNLSLIKIVLQNKTIRNNEKLKQISRGIEEVYDNYSSFKSYKELHLSLILYPPVSQKEMLNILKLKRESIIPKFNKILTHEKIINFLKNYFPINELLGNYKKDFNLDKNWYNNLDYNIEIKRNRINSDLFPWTIVLNITLNPKNILK